jgi:hypothetical protein
VQQHNRAALTLTRACRSRISAACSCSQVGNEDRSSSFKQETKLRCRNQARARKLTRARRACRESRPRLNRAAAGKIRSRVRTTGENGEANRAEEKHELQTYAPARKQKNRKKNRICRGASENSSRSQWG